MGASTITGEYLYLGLRPSFDLTSPLAGALVPNAHNNLMPSALIFLAAFSSLL